jgi:hypothetical protein
MCIFAAGEGDGVNLKPGQRIVVPDTSAEFIVVKPPTDAVEIRIGAGDDDDAALLLGKRYVDEASEIELLCVKPGPGPLEVDGRRILVKGAKPLPSNQQHPHAKDSA